MKRFLSMIVAICAFFAASAETPMVTLSHNGELSFFTNLTALNAALDSAKNGDTIYLSEGDFIVDGGAMTINKRVSIVGNGYGTHILGNLSIDMSSNENSNSVIDATLFDGVRIDKLYFYNSGDSRNNLSDSEVRRCWIRELDYGAQAGNNVTYDKCYIEKADFDGSGTVLVTNSKLKGKGSSYSDNDYMYNITAINCNISEAFYYPLTMVSCIFKRSTTGSDPSVHGSSCSIINSVLDFTPSDSSVYTHDCYIYSNENQSLLDEKLDCPLNLSELGYLGQDGTIVGIYGGENPFSENPSVPTVDTANSSVEYDAENNKLKVSITVKAD